MTSANGQLRPVRTLHDIALQAGAHFDAADPSIGIERDHYVFTWDELVEFVARVAASREQEQCAA